MMIRNKTSVSTRGHGTNLRREPPRIQKPDGFLLRAIALRDPVRAAELAEAMRAKARKRICEFLRNERPTDPAAAPKLRNPRFGDDKLDALVRAEIWRLCPMAPPEEGYMAPGDAFCAEEIAFTLRLRVHFIRQALHRLNLSGEVFQAERLFAHDSNRAPSISCGPGSGWAANLYRRLR